MRIASTTLLCLALLTSAQGQMPPEGTTVRIRLGGTLCRDVARQPIFFVYNQNDTVFEASYTGADCTWVAHVPEVIHPELTKFSLRLGPGIGRTRCRLAAEAQDQWNLQLTFTRAFPNALALHIDGPPVYYVREVGDSPEGDVPCREKRLLASDLDDVQFAIEDLRLQVYRKKRDFCGVIVDELVKGDGITIGPKELAPIVTRQGFQAQHCHASTLLPPGVAAKSLEAEKPVFRIKVAKP